jgi:pyruvate dehydrogenase E1 component alpha subunit
MDVEAVSDATERALTSIRGSGGPAFLEFRTYRFRAHSMYDPELYRDKDEVADWKTHDPIHILLDRMAEDGEIEPDALPAIEREVDEEIERAVAFAEASAEESVATLLRHAYAEPEEVSS